MSLHRSKRSEYEAVVQGREEDISTTPRYSLTAPTITDNMSMHSGTPLNPPEQTYPPPPLPSSHVQLPQETPGQPTRPGFPQMPSTSTTGGHTSRNPSWDMLGNGYRKFEHSYEAFDTRNASEAHLAFADGDTPKNGVRNSYNYKPSWASCRSPAFSVLSLPFERVYRHAMALVYCSVTCASLDTRNTGSNKLPQRRSTSITACIVRVSESN